MHTSLAVVAEIMVGLGGGASGTGGGGGRPEEEDDDLTVGVFARVKGGDSRDPSIVVRRRYDVQQDMQVKNLEFSLDWVFDDDAMQEEVYQIVAERRVARILRGYNVCLLAYGQTGSGKTYTMFGPEGCSTTGRAATPRCTAWRRARSERSSRASKRARPSRGTS